MRLACVEEITRNEDSAVLTYHADDRICKKTVETKINYFLPSDEDKITPEFPAIDGSLTEDVLADDCCKGSNGDLALLEACE